MVYDVIVIGGGPAGISAGLTLRRRNKSVAIVTGPLADIPLYKSHCVDNYPGMPQTSGGEMLDAFRAQALALGAEERSGLVRQIMPMAKADFSTSSRS